MEADPNYKICIYEIDVPCSSKKGNYKCLNPFFEYTRESLILSRNDPSEAYGHGLCLTSALFKDLQSLSFKDIIEYTLPSFCDFYNARVFFKNKRSR